VGARAPGAHRSARRRVPQRSECPEGPSLGVSETL
jgi:hypothetical protein